VNVVFHPPFGAFISGFIRMVLVEAQVGKLVHDEYFGAKVNKE
jgi:hypothetical protein